VNNCYDPLLTLHFQVWAYGLVRTHCMQKYKRTIIVGVKFEFHGFIVANAYQLF